MNNNKISHVNIAGGNILLTALFEKLITISAEENNLEITFEEQKVPALLWQLKSHSFFSIEIKHQYYLDFLANGQIDLLYELLQQRLKLIWDTLNNKTKEKDITSEYGIEKMQIFYHSNDKTVMYFRYPMSLTEDIEKEAWNNMIDIIKKYEKSEEKVLELLKGVPVQKDGLRYFQLDNKKSNWFLCDPLEKIVSELSLNYFKQKKEGRIRKPHIIVNEENFNEHFVWDQQWTLNFETKKIVLPPPNDIALYISLADKSLSKAKELFLNEHKKFNEPFYNPLLRDSEVVIIYDYFELIIAAIIFSYTAIETLANTCIIDEYKFIDEKDGITTIYSRNAIERKFALRDKLKKVLREILQTTDPTQEKWWTHFITLENIRNELIHVKKGKSQEIFSKLLSKNIFKSVEITKEIINYFSFYINQNQRKILIDFPYNFGSDGVTPYFMTKKDFWNTWKEMRGISDNKADENEDSIVDKGD